MHKSALVQLQNQYPMGTVVPTDTSLDVFDSKTGEHLVAVRKTGQGVWECQREQVGARDAFSLEPLPKHARFRKLFPNGKVGDAEEGDARYKKALAHAGVNAGRVPSIFDYAMIECKGDKDRAANLAASPDFQKRFADSEDAPSAKADPAKTP